MKFTLMKWCLVFFILLNQLTLVSPDASNDTSPEPEPFLMKLKKKRIQEAKTKCFERMEMLPPYEGEGLYCNRTWDGWLCWDDTKAGTTVTQHCPSYSGEFDPTVFPEEETHMRILFYLTYVGHSLSLVTLIISLGIFVYFKNLKCQRVTLHKNLFITYIMNSSLVLIQLSKIASDKDLVQRDPPMCKVLQFFHQYMMACNYYWMLCEGLHLHTLVVASLFIKNLGFWLYYLLGWGVPMLPNLIHAIARVTHFNDNCWLSTDTHLLYIIHAPIMGILVLNLIFLLDVIRVLVTKIRESRVTEFRLYIKVARAALILTPLLGVQFVLFPLRPDNVVLGQIYDFFMHFLVHFQGFSVAVIYCFWNKDVQATLKRHWERMKTEWCWSKQNINPSSVHPERQGHDIAVVSYQEPQRNKAGKRNVRAAEVIPLQVIE
ncbi:PREDICTED: calcitonin receptor [Elephantulus edwardii]|uniref:calcitonin receptor n=1 Tax=Elephantulus edwardii TaxID=28737 RepID=UPI0003F07DC5|nr:PREDICTED: calcitonin receptor [Elephantulus edwardii]